MLRPGALGGPGLPGKTRIGEATLVSNAVMEQDRFGRFISHIDRAGLNLLQELAGKMESRAKRYAPRRTGRLRQSIRSVVLSNGREARVFSNAPYAGVMELGSRPHLIHGVRANFRWKNGRRFIWNDPRYGPIDDPNIGAGVRADRGYENWSNAYGATVRHPGTKPHYYFQRAFTETWQEARFVMRKVYS